MLYLLVFDQFKLNHYDVSLPPINNEEIALCTINILTLLQSSRNIFTFKNNQ